MKRYVHAADDTAGYLQTTRFTTPSIKTDDQRNALEALEVAMLEKRKQFDAMCDIQLHLTSEATWRGVINEYEQGYHILLEATRSSFQAFVHGDQVIRKPRNAGLAIRQYKVEGVRGRVEWMSRGIED